MLPTGELDELIRLLRNSEHQDVWWLAAQELGYIGDKRAVEPLIDLMKHPLAFDSLTRKYTAWALGKLKDSRAVDALIEALHPRKHQADDDALLKETDSETIEAIEEALTEIGDLRALEPIIQKMFEDRFQDGSELTKWGDPAFQLLLNALRNDDEVRRQDAASFLGGFGDQRAVESLIELLQNDGSPQVRCSAAYSLGELRDHRAYEALLSALNDPHGRTREFAAHGLGKLANKRAIDALQRAAQDENPNVRLAARRALDKLINLKT